MPWITVNGHHVLIGDDAHDGSKEDKQAAQDHQAAVHAIHTALKGKTMLWDSKRADSSNVGLVTKAKTKEVAAALERAGFKLTNAAKVQAGSEQPVYKNGAGVRVVHIAADGRGSFKDRLEVYRKTGPTNHNTGKAESLGRNSRD